MNISKKLYILFSAMTMSMTSVFAETVFENAFSKIIETFTNQIIISGLAVLMIYWGLYAVFFWSTRFFAKEHGAQRVRVAISVVLSFFVGSFFVLSLSSAGDRLGYVATAWVMLFLLIGLFFAGIFKLYMSFFGKDSSFSESKNMTKNALFILSLLIFLFLFSLVFTKISWIVLSDGTGTFSLFEPGSLSGANSVQAMLEDVEREAQSKGGVAGGLIAIIASILTSIFGPIFAFAMVALVIFLGIIISRHKGSSGDSNHNGFGPEQSKSDMRRLIKDIATRLDDFNASFSNKLQLLKAMKALRNNASKSSNQSSSGVNVGNFNANDDVEIKPFGGVTREDSIRDNPSYGENRRR